MEARESPDFAVKRELEEETGLMVELISDAQPPSLDAEAVFLSRPYYVQLVKATESGKDFFHLDLAYLCRPVPDSFEKDQNGMPRLSINNELKAATWVPLCDLSQLNLAKNVQAALEMIRTSIQDILHLF